MQGQVNVFGLVLTGPEEPVTTGRRVVLAGLAPAGATEVTLRGAETSRAVRPRADGSFAVGLIVSSPVVLRAVAGRLSSPAVRVLVRPVVKVTRSGQMLRTRVTPARPGATVVLQTYDRERFDWIPLVRRRLDATSSAQFVLPSGVVRARVLVRGSLGWADATSPALGKTSSASSGGSGAGHLGSH